MGGVIEFSQRETTMTLIFKQIFGLLKLLNSDKGSTSIAAGVACGFILGLNPFFSLHCLLLFIFMFFFRVQIGAVFVCAFFFKLLSFALAPLFDVTGIMVLEIEALQGFFTTLYNMPIIPFTRFNNSLVMGSGVITFALSPFVFILAKILITKYRVVVVAKFQETKFWKWIKATALFKWYYKYDQFYG